MQRVRFHGFGAGGILTNAQCPAAQIEDVAKADGSAMALIGQASDKLGLSARGFHRVLKVARTLADLDGRDAVARIHIAEALSMRTALKPVSKAA
jgi:magnesium chelatase family protein